MANLRVEEGVTMIKGKGTFSETSERERSVCRRDGVQGMSWRAGDRRPAHLHHALPGGVLNVPMAVMSPMCAIQNMSAASL